MRPWIGVDLDGTLAEYGEWEGPEHIGPPIRPMVERVERWLREGKEVRIMTARVCPTDPESALKSRVAIEEWCIAVFGRILPITHEKDYGMLELWDDRCVAVEPNTGRVLGGRGQ